MAAGSDSSPDRCALCIAVADATRERNPFPYNSKLLETARFVVIPSLGPLVPGHVMIVSKDHWRSLAAMGSDAIGEYDALVARLRNAPFLRDSDALEAEHGSTPGDKAGACVVHTHVHWVPGMGRFLDEFKQRLSSRAEATLAEVGTGHGPYIYVRGATGQGLFDAHGLPSQSIRRILCEALDRDDSDWTQAPRLDWVKETVDAWREHGAEL